jgi:flagellar motor switch protein FliN
MAALWDSHGMPNQAPKHPSPITVVMGEIQADIDALLAEATALAQEAEPAVATLATPAGSGLSTASAGQFGFPEYARPPEAEDPGRILRLQVPVIVRLAERTMPLAEIVNLSSGAILEFDKPAEAELDLMINNKCIGQGQAVKVGENFGLRITAIGSVRDRIVALGPK